MTPTFIFSLFSLFLSFCILLPFTDQTTGWLAIDKSILVLAGAFLLAVLAIGIAARATVVAWITVLVLLAFAGNRRRVLVAQGRKITADVAVHLARVVVKERGVLAVACAAVLSLMAMICFTNA